MATRRRELLETLRQAFPQPVSDAVHDAYVVFTILKALDQVDDLKSQRPLLGDPIEVDMPRARAARMPEAGLALEQVIPQLVEHLRGMFIWGHPRSQINVIAPPSIASIIGVLLPSTYNPNLCSEETSRGVAAAEVRAIAMAADLVGYDPAQSDGLFTFGGTGCTLYGIKIGLEKAVPGTLKQGVREPVAVLASQQAHHCLLNVAGWLGIGEQSVVSVPTHLDNSIQLDALEEAARDALAQGRRIAAIVATMGTTDAFGVDDLAGVVALRDRLVEQFRLDYVPHVHADAVIGWAWSVFNDYDFEANQLAFRGRTLRALAAAAYRIRHLRLADSIGIDFHKTGFCPYISSAFLLRQRGDFGLVARKREAMPYIFQSGEHHPGMYTLETTRSGSGPMAALANLLLLGREGLRTLLGHAVEMAEALRERIEAHPYLAVLNRDNVGPVTLFRVYPDGVDTFSFVHRERTDPAQAESVRAVNAYNRRIFERVHAEALAGRGVVLSITDCYRHTDYGEPIVALKSYVLSPFSDEAQMRTIVEQVLAARDAIDAQVEQPPPPAQLPGKPRVL